ncbi:hypothetical protein CA13_58140 [Planctomycetes bacterium CA13]|uniref:Uncharacterized protein n=1 Tax=Novipirellula herctigrandis TaxID=2527986 RepID=A0A5C5ZB23_9BACT|nr:hypothetical protein CA13_58140 [Planctomycetes bacterium CA13]
MSQIRFGQTHLRAQTRVGLDGPVSSTSDVVVYYEGQSTINCSLESPPFAACRSRGRLGMDDLDGRRFRLGCRGAAAGPIGQNAIWS